MKEPLLPLARPDFDIEISIRTAVIGGLSAWLASRLYPWPMPPEVALAIGGLLGAAYDALAYRLKSIF